MDILKELLDITESPALAESMGPAIKSLNLGGMIEIFKNSSGFRRGDISNASKVHDVLNIKKWSDITKAMRAHKGLAFVIYNKNKPILVAKVSGDDIGKTSQENIDVAWNLNQFFKDTPEMRDSSNEIFTTFTTLKNSIKKHVSYDDPSGTIMSPRKLKPGLEALLSLPDVGPFDLKIIDETQDVAKVNKRRDNRPVSREDIALFKRDISLRLIEFKNSKIENITDVEVLIKKIFGDGKGKKINFHGKPYILTDRSYSELKMDTLYKGKEFTMMFSGDKTNYKSIYLTIKLVGMELKPVKLEYTDEDNKSQEVKL